MKMGIWICCIATALSSVIAEPGGIYTLTGAEKSISEIIAADFAAHPTLYTGESLKSYTAKFKRENNIGKRKLNPGDTLIFPETKASIKARIAAEKAQANQPMTFAEFKAKLHIESAGYGAGSRVLIKYEGGTVIHRKGAENGRGLSVFTWHEGKTKERVYDTFADDDASDEFASFINKLPTGTFVVLAVSDEATSKFTSRGQEAIHSIGGKRGLMNAGYRSSYICIGQKGMGRGEAFEEINHRLLIFP